MRVKELSYGRVSNLGNYETERLECTVELEEGDSPKEALNRARKFVHTNLDIEEERPDAEEVREAKKVLRVAGVLDNPNADF